MAVVEQLTVSSAVACKAVVSASFEAAMSGAGATYWNKTQGYYQLRASGVSGGSASVSPVYGVALTRARYSVEWEITLPANTNVTVYLDGHSSLGNTITFWDGVLRVELIKR